MRKMMSVAKKGNAEAQWAMGYAYEFGKCGLPRDPEEARAWYEQSARQGHSMGQLYYGNCIADQDGDYGEAYQWWLKAYHQGLDMARLTLGSCKFDFDDNIIDATIYNELTPIEA